MRHKPCFALGLLVLGIISGANLESTLALLAALLNAAGGVMAGYAAVRHLGRRRKDRNERSDDES